jgi:cytochrome c biogenesis protein CcmG, thiol:disulfide interchange protein DsbE
MKSQNEPLKFSWTITRMGLIGSLIIFVAAITYTLYQGDSAGPPLTLDSTSGNEASGVKPAPMPAPLPENVMQASINLLDGQKTKLSDYSGKVLVLDLWATWCGPCRMEIPHLVEIAKEYKSKGVEVIGLTNEDPETDSELVKKFSEAFNINYPIGWADPEMQMGLMRGRNGIPQTFIIGRDGKVLKHYVGFDPRLIPKMKAIIEAAVSQG